MRRYLAFTAAALFCAGAVAQQPSESTGSVFDTLDSDKSGSLSQQEAQAHATVAQNFSAADADGDGSLSRDEFMQAFTTGQSQPAPEPAPAPEQAPY